MNRGKNKPIKIILNILLVICIIVLGVSVFFLARTSLEYKAGKDEYNQIEQDVVQRVSKTDTLVLDFDKLIAMNPDFTAWLDIPGTPISYPVVHRPGDNETYLNMTFTGEYNGAGAIFADARADGDFTAPHTILYGHHMKNNTMFAAVPLYLSEDYRSQRETIYIYTPEATYRYKVFGARQTDIDDPAYRLFFEGGNEFSGWAASMGAPPNTSNVLTLSTCTNIEDDGRYIVLASLEEVLPPVGELTGATLDN